ncbi:YceI family protein [Cupriavidus sp. D384]|uniref:YceI family protein n=1 Tax=Cupriavidus sp. D384 TaxID=1538095 RepID=UPI0009EF465D|nr:YceI family protein [Cupriavidus sp. D384]
MRDSPPWFRATNWHAIVELAFATVISLTTAVGHAQLGETEGRSDRYVLQHSSVTLDVDAFSNSRIKMRFQRVNAQLEGAEGGLQAGRVTVTIDASSVEARPRFLSPIIRSSGMLDVDRYPEISFVSTRFVLTGEGTGWLLGNLTIRGITHPIRLAVVPSDPGVSPQRDNAIAFSASGEVSRREFGFSTWFPAVADAVRMNIRVEFVRGP